MNKFNTKQRFSMKNIMTAMTFLVITFFNVTPAMAMGNEEAMPVPEIIACESQGTCEMTSLSTLIKLSQEDEQVQQTMENVTINNVPTKVVSH